MPALFPPLPQSAPLSGPDGLVTARWSAWLRELVTRKAELDSCTPAADLVSTVVAAADATAMKFPLGANQVVHFVFDLQTTCNNTGGIKYALTVPSGAVFRAIAHGSNSSGGTIKLEVMTNSGALNTTGFNNYNGSAWTRIFGKVTNGSTPGYLQLQFAAGTAGQTATILDESVGTARVLP